MSVGNSQKFQINFKSLLKEYNTEISIINDEFRIRINYQNNEYVEKAPKTDDINRLSLNICNKYNIPFILIKQGLEEVKEEFNSDHHKACFNAVKKEKINGIIEKKNDSSCSINHSISTNNISRLLMINNYNSNFDYDIEKEELNSKLKTCKNSRNHNIFNAKLTNKNFNDCTSFKKNFQMTQTLKCNQNYKNSPQGLYLTKKNFSNIISKKINKDYTINQNLANDINLQKNKSLESTGRFISNNKTHIRITKDNFDTFKSFSKPNKMKMKMQILTESLKNISIEDDIYNEIFDIIDQKKNRYVKLENFSSHIFDKLPNFSKFKKFFEKNIKMNLTQFENQFRNVFEGLNSVEKNNFLKQINFPDENKLVKLDSFKTVLSNRHKSVFNEYSSPKSIRNIMSQIPMKKNLNKNSFKKSKIL